MTAPQDPQQDIHRVAADGEGNRIGKVCQVYNDDSTGQPQIRRRFGNRRGDNRVPRDPSTRKRNRCESCNGGYSN